MVLITKLFLKITNEKLYVSRRPGIIAWLLFVCKTFKTSHILIGYKPNVLVLIQIYESVSFIHKMFSTESVFYREYKDLV